MRCWTDPKGYAGFMQFIENEGLYQNITDLADQPHAGGKLKEALDVYASDLAYPWIDAACIRWAVFGKNTTVDDVPFGVKWLKAFYVPRQKQPYWGVDDLFKEPLPLNAFSLEIKNLLQMTDIWVHMLLQERVRHKSSTMMLWLHLAESVDFKSEARQLWNDHRIGECLNCILNGDGAELEMMNLVGTRRYLLGKASQHQTRELDNFVLPPGAILMV